MGLVNFVVLTPKYTILIENMIWSGSCCSLYFPFPNFSNFNCCTNELIFIQITPQGHELRPPKMLLFMAQILLHMYIIFTLGFHKCDILGWCLILRLTNNLYTLGFTFCDKYEWCQKNRNLILAMLCRFIFIGYHLFGNKALILSLKNYLYILGFTFCYFTSCYFQKLHDLPTAYKWAAYYYFQLCIFLSNCWEYKRIALDLSAM